MSDFAAALDRLEVALNGFLQSGLQSEGSGDPDPRGGMEPDELDCESVEPNGEIHEAVCDLEQFFDGKLPAPTPRNTWRDLQKVCRHEPDPYKRQNEAHYLAGGLKDWAHKEISKLSPPCVESGPITSEPMARQADAAPSTDFRSVRWFGERYTFTTTQAACVQVLWRNWEQGTPVISEATILDEAGSACDRLRDVFEKGKHPAMGTMIRPAGKGAFQLAKNKES